MKRRHSMPFGAECREDGSVRFRLWATAAHQVAVCSSGTNRPMRIPLEQLDDGWFELTTGEAKPGSQYSFRITNEQEVPDPASRFQPQDVHGPSEVIDPGAFDWRDADWPGRRRGEIVIYQLPVVAVTPPRTLSS